MPVRDSNPGRPAFTFEGGVEVKIPLAGIIFVVILTVVLLIAWWHSIGRHGMLYNKFSVACMSGDSDTASELLRSCPSMVRSKDKHGLTALHRVIIPTRSNDEIVRLLIAAGADVQSRDALGFTPLHAAAGAGHLTIVKLLVDAGADVNAETSAGIRPHDCALPHKEVREYLAVEGVK